MGFFSWKTADTNRSIANFYSNKPVFDVYMHDNKGHKWVESGYGGYGVFDGKDYYVLLAEMNGSKGNEDYLRDKGIDLAFGYTVSSEDVLYPCLTEKPRLPRKWDFHTPTEDCEYQGFFYDEEI